METMYERIRRLRIEKDMSQEQLGLLCGYSGRSAVSKIELGERDLTADKIMLFAKALGVSPSYLMDGDADESMFTTEELKLAVFGTTDISNEKLEQVLAYAKFVKEQ